MLSFKFHGADNTPITFHLSKDSKKILYLYSYMQRVADIFSFAICGLPFGYLARVVFIKFITDLMQDKYKNIRTN